MRVIGFALCLALIFAPPSQLYAQQSATVQRDSAAISLLSNVVSSMGGASVNSASVGVVAAGTLSSTSGGISGSIRWETMGGEFRYERPGPNGTIIFVSGHGNPAIANNGVVRRNIGHLALTTLPPHLGAANRIGISIRQLFYR